jgi:hypothetical protein
LGPGVVAVVDDERVGGQLAQSVDEVVGRAVPLFQLLLAIGTSFDVHGQRVKLRSVTPSECELAEFD